MTPDGRLRVLVAEDEADAADATARLLRAAGHEAHVAHDGLEALSAVRDDPPDVVVLDIGMAGLDGWELACEIRRLGLPRRPLLLALTGRGSAADRARSAAAGIDAHLVKPADPARLLQLLSSFARVLAPPRP